MGLSQGTQPKLLATGVVDAEGGFRRFLPSPRKVPSEVNHAQALLLADRDRSVGAVAVACGFRTESGFYRAFRAATGQTPAEYRRQMGTAGQ